MSIPINPLLDRVIAVLLKNDQVSQGGLILYKTTDPKVETRFAQVIKCGPGALRGDGTRIPMMIGVGDVIIFSPFTMRQVEWEGKEYAIIPQVDVSAIIPSCEYEKIQKKVELLKEKNSA